MKQVAILLALILCVIPSAYAKNTNIPQGLVISSDGFEFIQEPQRRLIPHQATEAAKRIVTGQSSRSSGQSSSLAARSNRGY